MSHQRFARRHVLFVTAIISVVIVASGTLAFTTSHGTARSQEPERQPVAEQSDSPSSQPADARNWSRHLPTGDLGVPLGTCVAVVAEIVDGEDLRIKDFAGEYPLRILSVGGKRLESAPVLHFRLAPAADEKEMDLANDDFALYKLRNGKKASELSSDEVKALKKGFVGSKRNLIVYETGAFRGIPKGLPAGMVWQDVGFCFQTYLVVCTSAPPSR